MQHPSKHRRGIKFLNLIGKLIHKHLEICLLHIMFTGRIFVDAYKNIYQNVGKTTQTILMNSFILVKDIVKYFWDFYLVKPTFSSSNLGF